MIENWEPSKNSCMLVTLFGGEEVKIKLADIEKLRVIDDSLITPLTVGLCAYDKVATGRAKCRYGEKPCP